MKRTFQPSQRKRKNNTVSESVWQQQMVVEFYRQDGQEDVKN